MNLAEFRKKYKNIFEKVEDASQYVVYYANTETCAGVSYISITKDFPGYVSEDDKGIKQNILKAGTKAGALICHLFMNTDEYGIIQGIENN